MALKVLRSAGVASDLLVLEDQPKIFCRRRLVTDSSFLFLRAASGPRLRLRTDPLRNGDEEPVTALSSIVTFGRGARGEGRGARGEGRGARGEGRDKMAWKNNPR